MSSSDEALNKVNNHIKEAFEILKQETDRVRKEKEAFDEVDRKPERVRSSKIVKLNVGGHFFSTTLETLNKNPGAFACFQTYCFFKKIYIKY